MFIVLIFSVPLLLADYFTDLETRVLYKLDACLFQSSTDSLCLCVPFFKIFRELHYPKAFITT